MTELGLLADTHGLLRPEALRALRGCDVLLHAGDVGSAEVLAQLRALGCEHIVRGNVDRGAWAQELPLRLELEIGGLRVAMVHDRADLGSLQELAEAGFQLAVFGHSHQPLFEQHRGLCLVNPGSCGPRRFRLPVTVARATLGARGAWIRPPARIDLEIWR